MKNGKYKPCSVNSVVYFSKYKLVYNISMYYYCLFVILKSYKCLIAKVYSGCDILRVHQLYYAFFGSDNVCDVS